jgi:hypothetical protein
VGDEIEYETLPDRINIAGKKLRRLGMESKNYEPSIVHSAYAIWELGMRCYVLFRLVAYATL